MGSILYYHKKQYTMDRLVVDGLLRGNSFQIRVADGMLHDNIFQICPLYIVSCGKKISLVGVVLKCWQLFNEQGVWYPPYPRHSSVRMAIAVFDSSWRTSRRPF
jgi:hypothetical protein